MAVSVQSQEVLPANGSGEFRGVAWVALAVLLVWGAGITARRSKPSPPPLASHQRSAFVELNPQDQGLFSDLRSAAEEIRALHAQNKSWPEPGELAADSIPPFAEDAVWAQRGRLTWQRLDAHAATHAVYWGRNLVIEWALVLNGESAVIWRRLPSVDGTIPQAIPQVLVLDGWTEFIPRNEKS